MFYMQRSQQMLVRTGRPLGNKAVHKRCAAPSQFLWSHRVPGLSRTLLSSQHFQQEGKGRGTVTATSSHFSSMYFCQPIQQKSRWSSLISRHFLLWGISVLLFLMCLYSVCLTYRVSLPHCMQQIKRRMNLTSVVWVFSKNFSTISPI